MYSLIRPPRTDFRWICCVSMWVTVTRGVAAEDQHPVQYLSAQGAAEAVAGRVHARRLDSATTRVAPRSPTPLRWHPRRASDDDIPGSHRMTSAGTSQAAPAASRGAGSRPVTMSPPFSRKPARPRGRGHRGLRGVEQHNRMTRTNIRVYAHEGLGSRTREVKPFVIMGIGTACRAVGAGEAKDAGPRLRADAPAARRNAVPAPARIIVTSATTTFFSVRRHDCWRPRCC